MQDNNKDRCSETDETENNWQTPGIVLRKARREQSLSEDEVCKELGLSIGALKALEGDDLDRLPAEIYVRGYIRSYCSLLGIEEQAVLACYQKYCQQLQKNEDSVLNEELVSEPQPVWKKPLFLGSVALLVAVIIVWIM